MEKIFENELVIGFLILAAGLFLIWLLLALLLRDVGAEKYESGLSCGLLFTHAIFLQEKSYLQ
jgi:hypothetical protein